MYMYVQAYIYIDIHITIPKLTSLALGGFWLSAFSAVSFWHGARDCDYEVLLGEAALHLKPISDFSSGPFCESLQQGSRYLGL